MWCVSVFCLALSTDAFLRFSRTSHVDAHDACTLTQRSKRGADRAAFKSRWKMVQERVRDIRHARKPSPKPTLEECVAILDEAASLPPPEQAPGGEHMHLIE